MQANERHVNVSQHKGAYLSQLSGRVDILLDGFQDGRVSPQEGAVDATATAVQVVISIVGIGSKPLHCFDVWGGRLQAYCRSGADSRGRMMFRQTW